MALIHDLLFAFFNRNEPFGRPERIFVKVLANSSQRRCTVAYSRVCAFHPIIKWDGGKEKKVKILF